MEGWEGEESLTRIVLEKYKDMPDHSIGPGRLGTWVVDKLVDCCQKQGIQLLTETRARKFITDDRGKVTGVLADTKDGQLLVNCKACVIAAGGYGRNMDLLKKYYPKQFNNKTIHSLCPPCHDRRLHSCRRGDRGLY